MVDDFMRPDYSSRAELTEKEVAHIVTNVIKEMNSGREVCDYHQKGQELLVSLNTKLTALLWVLGVFITVFGLPSLAYLVNLEKRVSLMENVNQRLIDQRNQDHPKTIFR